MSGELVDQFLRRGQKDMSSPYMLERLKKKLLQWRQHLPALREAITQTLPAKEIYIIGGAAENRLTALSDIDILIVTDKPPRKSRNHLQNQRKTRRKRHQPHLPLPIPHQKPPTSPTTPQNHKKPS